MEITASKICRYFFSFEILLKRKKKRIFESFYYIQRKTFPYTFYFKPSSALSPPTIPQHRKNREPPKSVVVTKFNVRRGLTVKPRATVELGRRGKIDVRIYDKYESSTADRLTDR